MSLSDPTPPLQQDETTGAVSSQDRPWLELALNSYESSTDYFDTSIRNQLEKNLDNFNNRHPKGSKYLTKDYQSRSRLFRPLSRTAGHKLEWAVATAFFMNRDVMRITPVDEDDREAVAAARLQHEVMQYRLTHTVPWFRLLIGGYQDGYKSGVIISRQRWKYRSKMINRVMRDDQGRTILGEDGKPQKVQTRLVLEDKLDPYLVAMENFRFDPAADWMDPVGTSPYLIEIIPMFVQDVLELMRDEGDDMAIEKPWKQLTAEQLQSARSYRKETVANARQGKQRRDPKQDMLSKANRQHETVWVHRNIQRRNGIDYMYYTAGTSYMLSDPVPLMQVCPWLRPSERDYVLGELNIETHITYPSSSVYLGEQLQAAANEIANQRIDNVKLAMNKRHRIRRGANIDLVALRRSVAGGAYETDNPESDVVVEETRDVTSSSYQEQDRINADFDSLMGNFSTSTIQTARNLNETVGGMSFLKGDANGMQEYMIRTGSETWVEPMLDQMMRLEQYYETDDVVIAIGKKKAEKFLRFQIDEVTDDMLRKGLIMHVNVGLGATDPLMRVRNLSIALDTLLERFPELKPRIIGDEVIKEVMAAVGYGDGERFLINEEDPTYQSLMEQVTMLQQQLEAAMAGEQTKLDIEQMRGETQRDVANIRAAAQVGVQEMRNQIDAIRVQIDAEQDDIKRGELELKRDSLIHQMLAQELQMQLQERQMMMQPQQPTTAGGNGGGANMG